MSTSRLSDANSVGRFILKQTVPEIAAVWIRRGALKKIAEQQLTAWKFEDVATRDGAEDLPAAKGLAVDLRFEDRLSLVLTGGGQSIELFRAQFDENHGIWADIAHEQQRVVVLLSEEDLDSSSTPMVGKIAVLDLAEYEMEDSLRTRLSANGD